MSRKTSNSTMRSAMIDLVRSNMIKRSETLSGMGYILACDCPEPNREQRRAIDRIERKERKVA